MKGQEAFVAHDQEWTFQMGAFVTESNKDIGPGSTHLGPCLFVSEVAVRQAWERLERRSGLMDLNFHDLRHEAISRMFEKGLNVPEVASISGHHTVSQLFRYVQVRNVHSL